MMYPIISQIAALGRGRVIGKNGKVPWDIPEDWQYFLDTIEGNPILMGHKTWDALKRPLSVSWQGVVTHSQSFDPENAVTFASVSKGLCALREQGGEEVFVIGGGELYRQAIPFTHRLYLTLIDEEFEGDVFFPQWGEFSRVVSEKKSSGNGYDYTFFVLERGDEFPVRELGFLGDRPLVQG
ncbi:MAG: dihydrofolate reductase [Opitutaceae bacterium]|nr:dihydrofolate reductase [Opitutaceae bacterium]